MAGERTEAATPKRKQDARNKGQVPRSQDLVAGLNLLAAALVLKVAGPRAAGGYLAVTQTQLSRLAAVNWDRGDWQNAMGTLAYQAGLAIAPIFAVLLAVGLVGGGLQTGFLVTGQSLVPDLSRLNPLKGLQRLFSLRSVTELVKSVIKLAVVTIAAWQATRRSVEVMPALADRTVAEGIPLLFDVAGSLLIQSSLLLTALGAMDYGYQWWDHQRSLRMTKAEVREEHKQTDGNPEVRSRRRQRMRELARRRKMLREIPTASVVVTNPTHFAVALRYRHGIETSPLVLAKGQDLLALQIRRLAVKHGVPVVEDPPLARSLYQSVPMGQVIPPELYRAVARIFAFLQRVDTGRGST